MKRTYYIVYPGDAAAGRSPWSEEVTIQLRDTEIDDDELDRWAKAALSDLLDCKEQHILSEEEIAQLEDEA